MILLDTNVLVDNLRGLVVARDALVGARRDGERLAASVLSKVEILAGLRPDEEPKAKLMFAEIEWIEVGDAIAESAGALAARFLRSHRGIEVTDYVIAATAELLQADLWTRNRKHFPMFQDLSEPYAAPS